MEKINDWRIKHVAEVWITSEEVSDERADKMYREIISQISHPGQVIQSKEYLIKINDLRSDPHENSCNITLRVVENLKTPTQAFMGECYSVY